MSSDPRSTGFLVPSGQFRVEHVIERSRFVTSVAHTPTAEDARSFIDEVRREFPDANHNCWAFVAGPPGSTAAVGLSDAGEPHGTAGRPMLDVLLHSGIGEIAAVVTRYFGGVKLGKGGLVRAYGGSVQQALATLPTVLQIPRVTVSVTVGYSDVEMLRRLFTEFSCDVISEAYGADVVYVAEVPAFALDEVTRAVVDRTSGRGVVSTG